MEGKQNIKDIPIAELPDIVRKIGLKPFAVNQIIQWLYQKGVGTFDEMTNLSKEARKTLAGNFYISRLQLLRTLESADGTKKFAWKLEDGNVIESVLIPAIAGEKVPCHPEPCSIGRRISCNQLDSGDSSGAQLPQNDRPTLRFTLCISTQVGCAMGCTFCRTAGMGFVRNLTQGEILDQILEVAKQEAGSKKHDPKKSCFMPHASCLNQHISNVVLMGMGEPFANYDNVINAVKIMINTKCLGLSKRHVTLSTSGLVPEIEKFAKDNLGIKLAISLNGTTDEQREKLMPINKKYPLARLFDALKKYARSAKNGRITFEYVMIGDFNDGHEDAKRLVKLLSHIPSKVNLIPLNVVHPLPYPPPSRGRDRERGHLIPPAEETLQRFAQYLRNKHIQVNIRVSRGRDILAACGQLAGE